MVLRVAEKGCIRVEERQTEARNAVLQFCCHRSRANQVVKLSNRLGLQKDKHDHSDRSGTLMPKFGKLAGKLTPNLKNGLSNLNPQSAIHNSKPRAQFSGFRARVP
jgi:hypothetical protein